MSSHNTISLSAALCLSAALLAPAAGAAETKAWEKKVPLNLKDLLAIQAKVQKMLPKALEATVALRAGGGSGSGVIVSKDGLVLTAGHVSGTPGRTFTVVLKDGREFKGKALGMSRQSDSGMLQILEPKNLPTVPWLKDGNPKEGDWCVSVGHPGGLQKARGLVVRVGRVIGSASRTIRTDCKLVGGDSGGPLFDLEGRVIGINSRVGGRTVDTMSGLNFHAAIDSFRKDWKDLKAGKRVGEPSTSGGYLGVFAEDHPKGAKVLEVIAGSPAEKSGLKEGDIIVEVNKKKVASKADLQKHVGAAKPDQTVKVAVERNGKKKTFDIKLTKRPSAAPPRRSTPPKKDEDKDDPKDNEKDE